MPRRERPIIVGGSGIMVRTDRIAGTETLSFQGGLEEPNEAPRHLDETTQRSLIAGSGRVDQNSALGWLPPKSGTVLEALLYRGELPRGENLRHHRRAANRTRRVRQSLQRNLARRPARISYPSPGASRSMPA